MQLTPESAQAVILAVSNQRNAALNELAVANAHVTILQAQLQAANAELEALRPKPEPNFEEAPDAESV